MATKKTARKKTARKKTAKKRTTSTNIFKEAAKSKSYKAAKAAAKKAAKKAAMLYREAIKKAKKSISGTKRKK
jgi:hypothetical protein